MYTDEINAVVYNIQTKGRDKKITLATVYNPPGKKNALETPTHLTDKYDHCIITCDLNSKYAYFWNDKSDSAVDAFLTLLRSWTSQYSMMTYSRNHAGKSVGRILDLVLASRKMGHKVAECTVKGDVGSDHLPVHIRLMSLRKL